MERVCNAYVLCYDGLVTLEEGTSDALIVEYVQKGEPQAQIVVRLYHQHGDHYHFGDELYLVGETETLFSEESVLKPADDVDGDDGGGGGAAAVGGGGGGAAAVGGGAGAGASDGSDDSDASDSSSVGA
jgi:hypothetical protein